jgi:hypothetical protein
MKEFQQIIKQYECNNLASYYAIVDEQGNPAELADFLESELTHPVAKAKREKELKEQEYKAYVIKRLKNCV